MTSVSDLNAQSDLVVEDSLLCIILYSLTEL